MTAGYVRAHQICSGSKGRRNLGSVEHREPAAASRADVVQDSAGAQAHGNIVDRAGNSFGFAQDGINGVTLFGDEQLDQRRRIE